MKTRKQLEEEIIEMMKKSNQFEFTNPELVDLTVKLMVTMYKRGIMAGLTAVIQTTEKTFELTKEAFPEY